MCKEPEALVPIVSSKAQQVILVGDHKQLQPIILEKRAQNFGLGRSLFERYAHRATMLTIQYRMVNQCICSLTDFLKIEQQTKIQKLNIYINIISIVNDSVRWLLMLNKNKIVKICF